MAEEILVKEQLTDTMVEIGRRLLAELKNTEVQVSAAFWLYDEEMNEWHLTLVTPQLDSDGPRKLFFTILEVLQREEKALHNLQLTSVKLLSPNAPMVMAIAGANMIHSLVGRRISRAYFGGTYVGDMYMYFISDSIRAYVPANLSYERPRNPHD